MLVGSCDTSAKFRMQCHNFLNMHYQLLTLLAKTPVSTKILIYIQIKKLQAEL